MKIRPILVGMTALLVATSIVPVSAETVSLISASSHPTKMPWVGSMKDFVVPEINKRLAASGSTTKISWTELYGVGHFKAHDGLESVEKGLAHLAWVGTLWEPSNMPLQSVTFSAIRHQQSHG